MWKDRELMAASKLGMWGLNLRVGSGLDKEIVGQSGISLLSLSPVEIMESEKQVITFYIQSGRMLFVDFPVFRSPFLLPARNLVLFGSLYLPRQPMRILGL